MKKPVLFVALLTFSLTLPARADEATAGKSASGPLLCHNVYFSLKDNSSQARQKMVDGAKTYLMNQPDSVFLYAGTLAEEVNRPINDRDFDVSLHLLFKSKAAYDQYLQSEQHQKFHDAFKDNVKKVRVFDSAVEPMTDPSR